MQEALELSTRALNVPRDESSGARQLRLFAVVAVLCILGSAVFASWLPLPVSIVTVFLFAGPHNWMELRYFLMRLPVRFGRSRNFFLTAFIGLGVLTTTYVSLPLLYRTTLLSNDAWLSVIAVWNTLLLGWLSLLVWQRSKQKPRSDWTWFVPLTFALCAVNWFKPDLFSLALVYIHPLVALWFLDRHLRRTRSGWLQTYRRSLALVPLVLVVMIWQLGQTTSLAETNGLFWRITQHSGADLLPGVSSHLLVSVHLFLEMLHYAVWILALPLLTKLRQDDSAIRVWQMNSVPVARHPRGFPKTITLLLSVGFLVVLALWLGFSIDYSTTRDVYFTFAIAHVIAEAPFLLRML
ncbi:MAG TPA: hypothetical protein VI306_20145 [Pyrinomonadaceae bacterium]